MCVTVVSCSNTITHDASLVLQIRTGPQSDAVAMDFPSGEKHAFPSVLSPSSLNEAISSPDSASQSFAEPSSEADSMDLPSGEKETSLNRRRGQAALPLYSRS